jgi:hypothetical protein
MLGIVSMMEISENAVKEGRGGTSSLYLPSVFMMRLLIVYVHFATELWWLSWTPFYIDPSEFKVGITDGGMDSR